MKGMFCQLVFSGIALSCIPVLGQSHPDIGKLENFPLASRFWLASLVGEVCVNPEFPIEVGLPGTIKWKVENGQVVSEGAVLAIAATEKLDFSERQLALKQSRYGNELMDIELSNTEKRQTLVRSIDELEEKLAKMNLTESERKLLGEKFAQRLSKERAIVEKELKASREKLESDYFELSVIANRDALDLEVQRAKLDYEDLLRSSEVLSPVAGQLVIEVQAPIRKSTIVGRVVKQGFAEVQLEAADVHLRNSPAEELVIELRGDDGQIYHGKFLRFLEKTTMDRNAKIMVFDVQSGNEQKSVPQTLAGSRMIRVFRTLSKSGRVIPKADLLFKYPKEIESDGWASFFESRWAGIRVTHVAPRDIIVNLANEN